MCGICGEIRFDGSPADPSSVHTMNQIQQPRGPDGSGLFASNSVAFGHRRLSIIDISTKSSQPMVDHELGIALVFNGAIYNYPDLKEELQKKGYRFFSSGDTEVLIKAYHAWGEQFVKRLNGMFAFALWERDSGKIVMGRDRLGIKPLYYSMLSHGMRFASSLPALLPFADIDRSIDRNALHAYMTFHSVVPPPLTLVKGIRKLPPATITVLESDGTRRDIKYWEPLFVPDRKPDFEEWQERVLTVLRRSVQRRLIADVPVGVLLSGGLDSSLVVGLLAEAGASDLKTFSVGFEAVRGEKGDEFEYSDIVSKRFSTHHHRIFVESDRTLDNLEKCVRSMSEPMVSHDNIGFYLLSEEVAKHVKVVQSGQGADEVFAGYHWYPPMMNSKNPLQDYAKVFFDRSHDEYRNAVSSEFVSEDFSLEYVSKHFGHDGAENPVDKALRIDTTVMLVDDPVKRVDNMTMAWGLEARVPFLDHEIVELAASIPAEFKISGGGKHVLKEAARRVIPAEVIDRPKGYFPVPALKYLQGPYLQRVNDILNHSNSGRHRLFNSTYVAELLKQPEKHITPLGGSKLWQIALLHYWLQLHGLEE